ncbi:MAG: hypothetical protein IKB61_00225 [Elusimicrobiaceae bacterium]|nr:hypothetical protein [Elusimicrobiaceae bacterium]
MGNTTQIYSLVNDAASDFLGSTAVRVKDTSSFVDLGRQLSDIHSETNPYAGLDSWFGALACRIARTEVMTRLYERVNRGVITDMLEFGAFVERVYAELPAAGENFAWSVSNGQNPPTITAKSPYDVTSTINIEVKFYGLRGTWAIEKVFPYKQIKEAFLSEASMAAFIDSFYTVIASSMNIDMELLENLAINTAIALCIKNGKATNLLQVYNEGAPVSLTVSTCRESADFLSFSAQQIKNMKGYFKKPSKRFNCAAYSTWTPEEKQKLEVLSDFASASEFKLLANTFNSNMAKIPGTYEEIPAWQGAGKDEVDFESASTIDVKNVGVYADESTGAAIEVKQSGVVAFLRDEDAVKGYFGEVYTWEVPNPRQRTTNHGEEAEIGFAVDPHCNMWAFYIADPTP